MRATMGEKMIVFKKLQMPRSAMPICTAGLGICIPVQIRRTELKLQYYSKGLDRTAIITIVQFWQ